MDGSASYALLSEPEAEELLKELEKARDEKRPSSIRTDWMVAANWVRQSIEESCGVAEADPKVALDELRRELKLRESYYSRWIAQGRLTQADAQAQLSALRMAEQLVREIVEGKLVRN